MISAIRCELITLDPFGSISWGFYHYHVGASFGGLIEI